MDYSTLQARVLSRLNMTSTDPVAAQASNYINEAIHQLDMVQADGWPWCRVTVDLPLTASTASYTFTTIGAIPTPTISVSKILDVKLLRQSQYYQPMDLIHPNEAELTYPQTQNAIPEAYFVEAQTLFIYPTPDTSYTARVRLVKYEPDLSVSTSSPVMPTPYHSAIVEAALVLFYETLQDGARAEASQKRVDGWVDRMKRTSPEYKGQTRVTVREPL